MSKLAVDEFVKNDDVCEFTTNEDVCEFTTNELVCELVTKDAVAELLINPKAVICAELDIVPDGVLPPPIKNEAVAAKLADTTVPNKRDAVVAKLELKTVIDEVCELQEGNMCKLWGKN